ncbi:MAG: CDP-glycerol glycerophosphotransferase family protein [Candidatus Hodarchaeales archaeon]
MIVLDYIIPKDSRLLVFGSLGGKYIGGNSEALFDYISNHSDNVFRCFFFSKNPVKDARYKSVAGLKISLRTLWIFLRAKTILVTHGLSDFSWLRPSSRKNYIKLWHGRPGLKGDGYSFKSITEKQLKITKSEAKRTTFFLVCSELEAFMRSYSHNLHPNQILHLGYPRNDKLFRQEQEEESKIRSNLENTPDYSAVLLYAPTWRGHEDTKFFPFSDFDEAEFKEWLEENKILLLLRAHPNDNIHVNESKWIRNFSFEKCAEIETVFPEIDILITDYSSITADFLLLEKPILYITYDKDWFDREVGSCYGNFDFWTPGPKVTTFDQLRSEIKLGLEKQDEYVEQRRFVNSLINSYQTGNSSERIYIHLRKFLGV